MNMLYIKHIIFFIVIYNVAGNKVKVRVEQGWLEGEVLDLVTKDGQYNSFKGIPYARPPIGTLRFKAPQPPLPWSGIRNATQHGSVCPQNDLQKNVFIPGNEDCLFINVYSPNIKPYRLLPVIVFIHGGAYKSGSGNVDNYGPDFLVRKNMVVATLNYRLDALGFLCLGTKEVPGNAGLKDQVAGLKWVQRNIKRFGGDPNRVTLMGQSAGSASVGLHITSPMSKGLFQRAVAMSGSPFCDWALPFYPERRAFVLGKKLGLKTEDPDELLQFLQSVPSYKLVDRRPNILSMEEYSYNPIKMYHFVPVIEKYNGIDNFLPYNIYEKITHINNVDILFGHTDQETVSLIEPITSTLIGNYEKYPELFVPGKTLIQVEPNRFLELSDKIRNYYFGSKSINSTKEFINYANDATFIYDTIRFFLRLPFISNTVRYSYQFSITSSRNVYGLQGEKYGIHGAAHYDDLMHLFDPKALNLISDKNSTEFVFIDLATTLLTNFAKYGNPTHNLPSSIKWPLFNSWSKQYLDVRNNGPEPIATVLSLNDNDRFIFWEQFYSYIGSYI